MTITYEDLLEFAGQNTEELFNLNSLTNCFICEYISRKFGGTTYYSERGVYRNNFDKYDAPIDFDIGRGKAWKHSKLMTGIQVYRYIEKLMNNCDPQSAYEEVADVLHY